MRDVFPAIDAWNEEGDQFAIAVVINTWGSSPRKIGSWMVVHENGEFQGSVSGGCVESAVIQEAMEAINGHRSKVIHFGVADDTAWDVGLACGGEIDIFIRPFPLFEDEDHTLLKDLQSKLASNRALTLAMIIRGPEEIESRIINVSNIEERSSTEGISLTPIYENADKVDQSRPTQIIPMEILGSEVEVFYIFYPPDLKLIIVGGAHISIALAVYAKELGYRVYVIDPRRVFGARERFPEVDGLVNSWPDRGLEEIGLDEYTAVAVLSHDPKLDDPALRTALQSDAFYVGALGSRITQEKRKDRLIKGGLKPDQIEKLHAPIGLDLGGTSPEEIALSIIAEIVSVYAK